MSQLVKLAVQSIVEEALEGKVADLLGRGYYERREGQDGYRNGYRRGRLKTSEGEIGYASPQVREVDAGALAELDPSLSTDVLVALFARLVVPKGWQD